MQVSKALEMDNGISGLEVTGIVKRVFEVKTIPGKGGRSSWKAQNIVLMDAIDNSISVITSLRKGFLNEDDKGAVITLPECERGMYEKVKDDGSVEPVNKLECRGIPKKGGGNGSVVSPPSPGMAQKPTPPPVPGPMKPNVDWDKKDLLIARESAFKSAATIIAAQIQVGAVAQSIDIMEYAARMSDFFVQVIYGGYVKKEPEAPEVTETTKEEMEKRFSIIKMLQTAQSRYNVSLEDIMVMANDRFGKEYGKISELQQLNHDKLEMLLKEIVDTKALHKPEKPAKPVEGPKQETADDSLL